MVSTQEERLPVRVSVSVRGLNALDHSPTIRRHSPLYCMHFPFTHSHRMLAPRQARRAKTRTFSVFKQLFSH
jgi:hypothetical protein